MIIIKNNNHRSLRRLFGPFTGNESTGPIEFEMMFTVSITLGIRRRIFKELNTRNSSADEMNDTMVEYVMAHVRKKGKKDGKGKHHD